MSALTPPDAPAQTQPRQAQHHWWQNLSGPLALLGPSGIWLLLFMVLPTLLILEISLVPGLRPGQPTDGYGLGNYLQILQPVFLGVVLRTVRFALVTTVICLVVGFPVAYWLALMAPKQWRNLLLVAFILPLWTSSLLRTYAWIMLLRRSGLINVMLTSVGLPGQSLMNTEWAVYIGLVYNFLPYMVLILYASLERLDTQLLEAAADLGASPNLAFWKVTVPQTLPGIAAGSLLVFITSVGDFIVPALLGGPSSMTLPRLVYNQFLGVSRNWGFGSALSMTLILAVSIGIALLLRYGDRNPETYS
ncbi:MAG: ABC transporter permease [Cyanobacteria bacterium J06632_22]